MPRLCLVSDLHGHLPAIPDADAACLCGDFSPSPYTEEYWLRTKFAPWLSSIADRGIQVIGVAGNHDFLFERHHYLVPPLLWHYLQDDGIELYGLKFWGSPWSKRFHDWAFNADEDRLERIWAAIPDDTDILLLHGPPHGCGDRVTDARGVSQHVGSPSLTARIRAIRPKLVVCGHIHEGYGRHEIDGVPVLNVAHMNERYEPVNPPIVIDL